jgi:signal transduction histidine kinase
VRGAGSAVFAGILLVVAGTLNIIYGIGALGDANVFVNDTRLIFSNLNTLGWVLIILGVIQLTAGFSLFGGGTYGRVIGIAAATLGAIDALMSVGGAYPFWSLGLFAICVIVIHGLVVLGEPERT